MKQTDSSTSGDIASLLRVTQQHGTAILLTYNTPALPIGIKG